MSSTVRSYGYIGLLVKPIKDAEAREELSERLWDGKTDLDVNYEGTLLFLDQSRSKSITEREDLYHFTIGNNQPHGYQQFFTDAAKHGVEISLAVPYSCIWYNGSDSPMSMMTLEEFKKHLKG